MESKGEIVENLVKDYEKGLSKDQLREYEQWKRSGAGGPSGTSEPTAEYGGARPEEAAAPSGRDGGGEPGTRGGTEGELDSVRRIAERHAEIEKHLGTKYSFSHERANHGEVFYENERGETSLAGEESSGNVVREASLFDYDNEDERARRQQQGARQLSLFGEEHREEVGAEHRMQRERQMSLFDRDFSEEAESDIDGAASRLDERLDEYSEKLSELLTVPEELRTDEMEEAVVGIRDALMGDLVDYYESKRNDRGEARERARDMIVQLQAQAIIAETRRRKLLSEETEGDADGETATPPTTPADRPADASKGGLREATDGDLKQTHVTAGGEELSFNHTGWLPKLGGGHFTLMERRFVEDGSVPMSGTTRVESADDVAYMMRTMECTHVL